MKEVKMDPSKKVDNLRLATAASAARPTTAAPAATAEPASEVQQTVQSNNGIILNNIYI
jgi:hypothetical protein